MLQKFNITSYAIIFFLFVISFGLAFSYPATKVFAQSGDSVYGHDRPSIEQLADRVRNLRHRVEGLEEHIRALEGTLGAGDSPLGV